MPQDEPRADFLARMMRLYRGLPERVTPAGQYLLAVTLALAMLGLDTRRTQAYSLFAVAAAMLLTAAVWTLRRRPQVQIECRLPERATALAPLRIQARVRRTDGRPIRDLMLSFPRPHRWGSSVRYDPPRVFLESAEGPAEGQTEFCALRRGRYILRGPAARWMDPLRLAGTRATSLPDQALLVYPRYYSMDSFLTPVGRRYQPGGIPLSSNTGDAIEFIGTREYREGDPMRNIHWRSWARRGAPVVKEYQEEYFCRIALVLDTFLPARMTLANEREFEAGITVLASIADFFSRSEFVVDILAAGPDIYEVSAGRSLAYLDNILDVLACLEPCHDLPFTTIGPHLFEKLAQLTSVVVVLQDWDEARQSFLRRVATLGTSVKAIVVHDGPTAIPWQGAAAELGDISRLSTQEVEQQLARAQAGTRGSPRAGK